MEEVKEKTFGMFISELRKQQGYTQGELADILHISNKTISSWETDKTQPDILMIPILAETFKISCDELLKCKRCESSPSNSQIHNNQSIKLKVYRLLTILLVFIIVLISIFTGIFVKEAQTGFWPIGVKIINGVVYEKNTENTYSVIGLADNYRGSTIVLKDSINGINVTTIRSNAFNGISKFESIILSKNIETIQSQAFMNCSVKTVVLNEGLLKIEKYAFYNSMIETITFPDTLEIIEHGAFKNCSNLVEVDGGKGIIMIDTYAFANCVSLKKVIITGNVSFNESVFKNTNDLEIVELKNAVSLAVKLFDKSGVTVIYLPKDIKNFNQNVFSDCYTLKEIYLDDSKQDLNEIFK